MYPDRGTAEAGFSEEARDLCVAASVPGCNPTPSAPPPQQQQQQAPPQQQQPPKPLAPKATPEVTTPEAAERPTKASAAEAVKPPTRTKAPKTTAAKASATKASSTDKGSAATASTPKASPPTAPKAKKARRAAASHVDVDDAQRCEACGVLVHELAVARSVKLDALVAARGGGKSGKGGRKSKGGKGGRQAQKRREADESGELGRAIEEKMADVCEAEAAFHVCNERRRRGTSEAGGSALRTPRGKAYDWGSCSTLTLQRCKEVQEEHADEIIGALSDRGGAASGSRDGVAISMAHDLAVDTCAALFDGCDAERASLHLDVLVEAAAEAAAEAAGSTERDEL